MRNAAQKVELRYCELKEPVHIVGREWSFEWYPSEVERVIRDYEADHTLPVIARRRGKTQWDTLMLINELAQQGKIKVRPGWVIT